MDGVTPQDQYDLNCSRAFRVLKYSNDRELTELVRIFNRESSPFNHFLTNGQRDLAFNRGEVLLEVLEKIQARLNRLKYG